MARSAFTSACFLGLRGVESLAPLRPGMAAFPAADEETEAKVTFFTSKGGCQRSTLQLFLPVP